MSEVELRAAWSAHLGTSAAAAGACEDVLGRHREAHRRYHGIRHVTWVLRHVHALAADVPVTDVGSVAAAAFFHDVVYDPRAGDNEEQSARLAERVLAELDWAPARRAAVAIMIRATADHVAAAAAASSAVTSDGADTAVLLDADLAVLGAEPAAYQAYATGVRAEYGHLDDDAWRAGRTAVLDRFLAADPLYATAPGRTRWTTRARANLAAERAALVVD